MAKKKRNRNKKGRTGKKSSSALQNADADVGNEYSNSRDVFAGAMPNMDRTFKEFETEILLQEFENLSPEEQERRNWINRRKQ